jgi:hypothetical protein
VNSRVKIAEVRRWQKAKRELMWMDGGLFVSTRDNLQIFVLQFMFRKWFYIWMISITQDFNLYIYNLIIYYVQPNRMSYQHLWLTVIDYQILPTSRTFRFIKFCKFLPPRNIFVSFRPNFDSYLKFWQTWVSFSHFVLPFWTWL